MIHSIRQAQRTSKIIASVIAIAVGISSVLYYVINNTETSYADILNQPLTTNTLATLKPHFNRNENAPLLKGIAFDPSNPFYFNFYFDTMDQASVSEQDIQRMSNYFLGFLTVPQDKLWVNLSPYEEDRIIPHCLTSLQIGKDFLIEDYLLKQLTASLTSPQSPTGKQFWKQINAAVKKIVKTTNVPIESFFKVWVVPDGAEVYEYRRPVGPSARRSKENVESQRAVSGTRQNKTIAFIKNARLRVMLESDYLAMQHKDKQMTGDGRQADGLTKQINNEAEAIFRKQLLPIIQQQVNNGAAFAPLRQMYYALIMATYFKQKLRQHPFYQHYFDQEKTVPIAVVAPQTKQYVYQQYCASFKKGWYSQVKHEYDQQHRRPTTRRYIAGGLSWGIEDLEVKQGKGVDPSFSGEMLEADGVPQAKIGTGPLVPLHDNSEDDLALLSDLKDLFGSFGNTGWYKYLVGPVFEELGQRVGFYLLDLVYNYTNIVSNADYVTIQCNQQKIKEIVGAWGFRGTGIRTYLKWYALVSLVFGIRVVLWNISGTEVFIPFHPFVTTFSTAIFLFFGFLNTIEDNQQFIEKHTTSQKPLAVVVSILANLGLLTIYGAGAIFNPFPLSVMLMANFIVAPVIPIVVHSGGNVIHAIAKRLIEFLSRNQSLPQKQQEQSRKARVVTRQLSDNKEEKPRSYHPVITELVESRKSKSSLSVIPALADYFGDFGKTEVYQDEVAPLYEEYGMLVIVPTAIYLFHLWTLDIISTKDIITIIKNHILFWRIPAHSLFLGYRGLPIVAAMGVWAFFSSILAGAAIWAVCYVITSILFGWAHPQPLYDQEARLSSWARVVIGNSLFSLISVAMLPYGHTLLMQSVTLLEQMGAGLFLGAGLIPLLLIPTVHFWINEEAGQRGEAKAVIGSGEDKQGEDKEVIAHISQLLNASPESTKALPIHLKGLEVCFYRTRNNQVRQRILERIKAIIINLGQGGSAPLAEQNRELSQQLYGRLWCEYVMHYATPAQQTEMLTALQAAVDQTEETFAIAAVQALGQLYVQVYQQEEQGSLAKEAVRQRGRARITMRYEREPVALELQSGNLGASLERIFKTSDKEKRRIAGRYLLQQWVDKKISGRVNVKVADNKIEQLQDGFDEELLSKILVYEWKKTAREKQEQKIANFMGIIIKGVEPLKRRATVIALGEIITSKAVQGDKDSLKKEELLMNILKNTTDKQPQEVQQLCMVIAQTLAGITYERYLSVKRKGAKREYRQNLATFLDSSDWRLQLYAVYALGKIQQYNTKKFLSKPTLLSKVVKDEAILWPFAMHHQRYAFRRAAVEYLGNITLLRSKKMAELPSAISAAILADGQINLADLSAPPQQVPPEKPDIKKDVPSETSPLAGTGTAIKKQLKAPEESTARAPWEKAIPTFTPPSSRTERIKEISEELEKETDAARLALQRHQIVVDIIEQIKKETNLLEKKFRVLKLGAYPSATRSVIADVIEFLFDPEAVIAIAAAGVLQLVYSEYDEMKTAASDFSRWRNESEFDEQAVLDKVVALFSRAEKNELQRIKQKSAPSTQAYAVASAALKRLAPSTVVVSSDQALSPADVNKVLDPGKQRDLVPEALRECTTVKSFIAAQCPVKDKLQALSSLFNILIPSSSDQARALKIKLEELVRLYLNEDFREKFVKDAGGLQAVINALEDPQDISSENKDIFTVQSVEELYQDVTQKIETMKAIVGEDDSQRILLAQDLADIFYTFKHLGRKYSGLILKEIESAMGRELASDVKIFGYMRYRYGDSINDDYFSPIRAIVLGAKEKRVVSLSLLWRQIQKHNALLDRVVVMQGVMQFLSGQSRYSIKDLAINPVVFTPEEMTRKWMLPLLWGQARQKARALAAYLWLFDDYWDERRKSDSSTISLEQIMQLLGAPEEDVKQEAQKAKDLYDDIFRFQQEIKGNLEAFKNQEDTKSMGSDVLDKIKEQARAIQKAIVDEWGYLPLELLLLVPRQLYNDFFADTSAYPVEAAKYLTEAKSYFFPMNQEAMLFASLQSEYGDWIICDEYFRFFEEHHNSDHPQKTQQLMYALLQEMLGNDVRFSQRIIEILIQIADLFSPDAVRQLIREVPVLQDAATDLNYLPQETEQYQQAQQRLQGYIGNFRYTAQTLLDKGQLSEQGNRLVEMIIKQFPQSSTTHNFSDIVQTNIATEQETRMISNADAAVSNDSIGKTLRKALQGINPKPYTQIVNSHVSIMVDKNKRKKRLWPKRIAAEKKRTIKGVEADIEQMLNLEGLDPAVRYFLLNVRLVALDSFFVDSQEIPAYKDSGVKQKSRCWAHFGYSGQENVPTLYIGRKFLQDAVQSNQEFLIAVLRVEANRFFRRENYQKAEDSRTTGIIVNEIYKGKNNINFLKEMIKQTTDVIQITSKGKEVLRRESLDDRVKQMLSEELVDMQSTPCTQVVNGHVSIMVRWSERKGAIFKDDQGKVPEVEESIRQMLALKGLGEEIKYFLNNVRLVALDRFFVDPQGVTYKSKTQTIDRCWAYFDYSGPKNMPTLYIGQKFLQQALQLNQGSLIAVLRVQADRFFTRENNQKAQDPRPTRAVAKDLIKQDENKKSPKQIIEQIKKVEQRGGVDYSRLNFSLKTQAAAAPQSNERYPAFLSSLDFQAFQGIAIQIDGIRHINKKAFINSLQN